MTGYIPLPVVEAWPPDCVDAILFVPSSFYYQTSYPASRFGRSKSDRQPCRYPVPDWTSQAEAGCKPPAGFRNPFLLASRHSLPLPFLLDFFHHRHQHDSPLPIYNFNQQALQEQGPKQLHHDRHNVFDSKSHSFRQGLVIFRVFFKAPRE